MQDRAKVKFLRNREYGLDRAVETLAYEVDRFADDESHAKEFADFTNRLEACLREIKSIRAAIGDKADELGGVS
jgi:hypothetical protein